MLILAMYSAVLAGCAGGNVISRENTTTAVVIENAEYKKISPQDAEVMMSGDVIILDVRTIDEFNIGHIPNAILLPDNEIAERAGDVITDKSQTILVYCRSGGRSERSARLLIDLGYTDVYDFGGIMDWTGEIVRE